MRFGGEEEEEEEGVGVSLWAAAAAAGPGNRSGGLEEVFFGESPSPSSPSWGSNVSTSYDRFGRNESLAKVEVAVLAVTLALAVSGNAAVLWSLGRRGRRRRRRRKQPSRMHRFMLHLSLADLSVAFFQVLPQLCWEATHRFHGPDGLCRVVKHLQVFGMFASAYLLVVMTADRYVAVCHPLRTLRQPPRRPGCMIAGAWGLSLLLSTPQYFIFSLSEVERGSQVYDCWAHFVMPWGPRAYITWVTGSVFVGPVLVLATCYGLICSRLWSNARDKGQGQREEEGVVDEDGTKRRRMLRMQRRMQAGSTPPSPPPAPAPPGGALRRQGMLLASPCVSSVKGISRAKIRTVKMTLVIVSAYIVCWAPFFTVQMRSVWEEQAAWVESEDILITVTALLASLNSCCNPWIYMFFSGHLLQDFLQSFLCCRKMKQRLNKEDSESISRRQTSFTNNRSPTNSVDTWRESQHFSQSIKFIPTSS